MVSPSSSNLLSSPAFAQTARAEASTAASLLRANKPSAETSDRFAQLMKSYAGSASTQTTPTAPELSSKAPTAAAPAPPAVARPPEGKTELQRQEQKLAQKQPNEVSKPRTAAVNQAAKSAGSAAAKTEATQATSAASDASSAATEGAAQSASAASKKTRTGDGDNSNATADQTTAAAAAERNSASNAATQTGILGQAQVCLAAAQSTQAADATETTADNTDRPTATDGKGLSAQLGASQARTTAQHALQIDGTATLQAQQATASDSRAEAVFGNELRALLGSAAAGDVATAAPKLEGVSTEGLIGMMAAAGSAAPAAPEARADITGSRQISLSQPLTEPGFAPEMAARLSVLAADGVQEARLHLNPAEMGPVTVQIIIEGQQAQISFHAEHEQTRAVLEQSLPDLAAALRDSGLTLSGGGVFQQPGDQSGAAQSEAGSEAGSDRRSDARLSVSAEAAPMPIRQSRGVVDLYA